MFRWKLKIRRFHRYLSLIIGLQFLFWTASGVYFSLVPIEKVRGEDFVSEQPRLPLRFDREPLSPTEVLHRFGNQFGEVRELRLQLGIKGPAYALFCEGRHPKAMVDAYSGALLEISAQEAAGIAKADYGDRYEIAAVQRLEKAPSEYGGPLPVFQVSLKDSRATHIYVSPVSGQVLTHRNRFWRVYDFLWRLHILDFEEGEDFNNGLLRIAALLGLVLSLSGFALWATSRKWRFPQRSRQ